MIINLRSDTDKYIRNINSVPARTKLSFYLNMEKYDWSEKVKKMKFPFTNKEVTSQDFYIYKGGYVCFDLKLSDCLEVMEVSDIINLPDKISDIELVSNFVEPHFRFYIDIPKVTTPADFRNIKFFVGTGAVVEKRVKDKLLALKTVSSFGTDVKKAFEIIGDKAVSQNDEMALLLNNQTSDKKAQMMKDISKVLAENPETPFTDIAIISEFEAFSYIDSQENQYNGVTIKAIGKVDGSKLCEPLKEIELYGEIIQKVIVEPKEYGAYIRLCLSRDYIYQYASDLFNVISSPEKVKEALYIDDNNNSLYFKGVMEVTKRSDSALIKSLAKGKVIDVVDDPRVKVKGLFDHNVSHIAIEQVLANNLVNVRFYINPKYHLMISKGTLVKTMDKKVTFRTLHNTYLKPGPAVNAPNAILWDIKKNDIENVYLTVVEKSVEKRIPLSQKWIKENECFICEDLPLWIDAVAKANKAGKKARSYAPGEVNTIIKKSKIAVDLDPTAPVENFHSTSEWISDEDSGLKTSKREKKRPVKQPVKQLSEQLSDAIKPIKNSFIHKANIILTRNMRIKFLAD